MESGAIVIVVGVGCRRGALTDELLVTIRSALTNSELDASDLVAVCTPEFKGSEPGIIGLVEQLHLPLLLASSAELERHDSALLTRSSHSFEHTGVASIAEASALAGVDKHWGRSSAGRLVRPRFAGRGVTCAFARLDVDSARAPNG